jgi:hypothetical protein
LEPNKLGAEYFRQHLGNLGFAHASLSLQKQWLAHNQRKVNHGRQGAVANVFLVEKYLLDSLNRKLLWVHFYLTSELINCRLRRGADQASDVTTVHRPRA